MEAPPSPFLAAGEPHLSTQIPPPLKPIFLTRSLLNFLFPLSLEDIPDRLSLLSSRCDPPLRNIGGCSHSGIICPRQDLGFSPDWTRPPLLGDFLFFSVTPVSLLGSPTEGRSLTGLNSSATRMLVEVRSVGERGWTVLTLPFLFQELPFYVQPVLRLLTGDL